MCVCVCVCMCVCVTYIRELYERVEKASHCGQEDMSDRIIRIRRNTLMIRIDLEERMVRAVRPTRRNDSCTGGQA